MISTDTAPGYYIETTDGLQGKVVTGVTIEAMGLDVHLKVFQKIVNAWFRETRIIKTPKYGIYI